MHQFLELLVGSIVHRPYVYTFFLVYLFFAIYQLGLKNSLFFTIVTYGLAFAAEYSSTRNGFPFGYYRYFDQMRTQELWISNVPFWDSLSFVFLVYFSWVVAFQLLNKTNYQTWLLGGCLMTLLDVVIDPVALQGEKWFLGKIYDYPNPGPYFGVTLENFMGWLVLGWVAQIILQRFCCLRLRPTGIKFLVGTFAVYFSVFLFNLIITAAIGDWILVGASGVVILLTALLIGFIYKKNYAAITLRCNQS